MTDQNFTRGRNRSESTTKTEMMAQWIEAYWIPAQADHAHWTIIGADSNCLEREVLRQFSPETELEDDYFYVGREPYTESPIAFVHQHNRKGKLGDSTGTYIYTFEKRSAADSDPDATPDQLEVLVMSTYHNDHWSQVSLACVPQDFVPVWSAFRLTCGRFAYPEQRVMIIGGNTHSYEANVDWESIILPAKLKQSILDDVRSFFDRGAEIYKKLNLNPFRKLLLAGVPGTGKTMLCNALAKWALEQDYQAIYVSSADQEGSKFWKIQHALYTASNAKKPSLIILEELDAYLHDEEKALILNVLDGAESFDNEKGTLLIATTNYPEAIDERVLKRPGRLDRIYVVPPVEDSDQAEDMLKLYLKDMWRDEHASLAPDLVGYPGSFVREVVVFALTQLVVDEVFELSEEDLRESYRTLRDQIEARNDLIIQNANGSSRTGFIKDS